MVDPKLLEYIQQKVGAGVPQETIKATLLQAGWTQAEVDEGFRQASPSVAPPSSFNSPQSLMQDKQTTPGFIRPRKSGPNVLVLLLVLIILIAIIGGGAYVYLNKSSIFGKAPYTQENLLSGLLAHASTIKSASYTVSASLVMVPRDADAVPFTTKLSNSDELKKQYANDAKRAQDVTSLLGNVLQRTPYPVSLQPSKLLVGAGTTDPQTNQLYRYALTENGKNFALSVTFETDNAISQVRRLPGFSEITTIISGKTVTFTKDSSSFFYLPNDPPQPFFVTLSEAMANVPPEVNASFSATAQSDFSNQDSPSWKFNADATGDFGDLSYKFDADAIKKDALYYIRINNMPSFFFTYIGLEKGQWVKIDPSKDTALNSFYPDFSQLSQTEKTYKENRQKITEFLQKMIATADSEHVIIFKNPPVKETVGGSTMYRYDLAINKDALVPFYKKMAEEYNQDNIPTTSAPLVDQGFLDYLQSPEFSETFDYYQKNTSLTLWVDSQGNPATVSYTMRVVPADSATQLKNKQANLTFKLQLADINKPVIIEAPTDAKDIDQVIKEHTPQPK